MNLVRVLYLTIIIFIVQISAYLMFFDNIENCQFNIVTGKGDQGLSIDLIAYSALITDNANKPPNLFQTDPFLYEFKNKSLPTGNFTYLLSAIPLLLGLNITCTFLILPFFSFLLSVFFISRIVALFKKPEKSALFEITMVVLLSGILLLTSFATNFNLPNFFKILHGESFLPRNLDYIGRFPNIQFSISLLLFWVYRLMVFIYKSPSLKNSVYLGISLAVLQYSYFYFWTAAGLFTLMICVLYIQNIKRIIINTFPAFLAYLVLTLPFWIKLATNTLSTSDEFLVRLGVSKGFHIWYSEIFQLLLVLLVFLLLEFFLTKRQRNNLIGFFSCFLKNSAFVLSLIFTVLFLRHLQLIIGYNLQSYHWYLVFYYPLLVIVSVVYFTRLADYFNTKIVLTLAWFCAFVVIVTASVNNIYFGKTWSKYLLFTSQEKELLDFTRQNCKENSVVLSNNLCIMGILKAHNNIYSYIPISYFSVASDSEIIERFVYGFKLMGYSENEIIAELKKGEKWFPYYLKDIKANKFEPELETAEIPDNFCSLVYLGSRSYLKNGNYVLTSELENRVKYFFSEPKISADYKLDYIVIYKKFYPVHNSTLHNPVFENEKFALYSIR